MKKDKTTTTFPKMGTTSAVAKNVSGAPSKNTKPVKKTAHSKGGSAEPATANARQGILERNGFKGAPQMAHVQQNNPEASSTYRNVRLMNSAVGNRDFYLRRQYGQNT